MRIVHLSYVRSMSYNEPELWLRRINFFTVLVEEMAKTADVKSIHCINYSGVHKKNGAEFHFLKTSWLQFLFPFGFHRYVRTLDPEVVVVHGLLFSWQVLWLRQQLGKKIKIVVQHHAERPLGHYKEILQKLVDRSISAYFFTSFEQARPWVEKRQIKSLDKVFEIMEVPSVFGPIDKKEAIKKTNVKESKIYLWVGRLDANKDPLTLVTAFIRFTTVNQEAHLYVVFHGDELVGEVKKILLTSPGASDRITLVGKVAHHELLYWYNSADFVISTSHYEGSGIAVCEGMSCGCIPIVTKIPSLMMMTGTGKCGLHFGVGNVEELFFALSRTDHMDLALERTKVLHQYKDNLSSEAISNKMMCVFAKLIKA